MTAVTDCSITRELRDRVLACEKEGANATVAVAMSGGVDSSVAAALLRDCGLNVIGLTMKAWLESSPDDAVCAGGATETAAEEARRVADTLGIRHYVVDLQEDFRKLVVDEFCREYKLGRTPNPCIVCNRRVKFGLLLQKATDLGADWLATGHYARVTRDTGSGRYLLLKGVDPRRDQSYVLYRLTQAQLSRILLPLGSYEKKDIRSLARDYGLPVADKSESREICFIPDNDYRRFLREYRGESALAGVSASRDVQCSREGVILNTEGEILGTHRGIEDFTIGQRKGLGIASDRRMYVVELDPDTASVVVGRESELYSSELVAGDCNWISVERLPDLMRASAKIRYASPPVDVAVSKDPDGGGRIRVAFSRPVRAVTPGQAVVLYSGETVIGGGTIERAIRMTNTSG